MFDSEELAYLEKFKVELVQELSQNTRTILESSVCEKLDLILKEVQRETC